MSAQPHAPFGVLFVCLGNICRSPLARAIFEDLAIRQNTAHRFDIDSCGMGGWHVGNSADPRAIGVARRNGLSFSHTARQLSPVSDFHRFGLVLAMDRSNRDALLRAGAPPTSVRLMRSFDPAIAGFPEADLDIPDPYYGGDRGFDTVYRMLVDANTGLLAHLLKA